MALQYLAGLVITGLSSDTKPTTLDAEAWRFLEKDTGNEYTWDGVNWILTKENREAVSFNAKQPRSSLIKILGDEFARDEASAVFLLEDLTDSEGGTSLTNNNSIDLTRVEDKHPLRGHLVPSLNGTNQYFSMATEAKVQVGTNSFAMAIDFSTTTTGAIKYIFGYGNNTASEQNYRLYITSANVLTLTLEDGTSILSVVDPIANRWQDGKLHRAVVFFDTTTGTDTATLLVDGQLIGSTVQALGTLDNVGTNFYIGAFDDGGVTGHWAGELSNFQLYQDADANLLFSLIPILSNPKLRETAKNGTVAWQRDRDSAGRINNEFGYTSNPTANDYNTCVINTSEGIYDMISLFQKDLNTGITEISIDGKIIQTNDHENGSLTYNNKSETKGIYLSAGSHILKIEETAGQDYLYQIIELIKRDGEATDDDASSGFLFFDELVEKDTIEGTFTHDTGRPWLNEYAQLTSTAGEFMEGTLFLKAGTYDITHSGSAKTTFCTFSSIWGDVKVLDNTTEFDIATDVDFQTTKRVYLKGGKTNVKILVDSTATGDDLDLTFISFNMVAGKNEEDIVNIWGTDDDFETVTGTTDYDMQILNQQLYSFARQKTTMALNDEVKHTRYFSGGTYLVRLLYIRDATGGIIDFGIDSPAGNNLFDGVNFQNALNDWNNEVYTIIDIARGYHDISILAQADGGTSDFRWYLTQLEFRKIGEKLQEGDDNSDSANNPVGEHQMYIPASSWKPRTTAGSAGLTTRELGAQNQDVEAMQFLDGSDTWVYYNVRLPSNWDADINGKFKFSYDWFRENDEATPETKTVEFEMSMVALNNLESIGGTAFGTAIGLIDTTDSATAENKIMTSDQSTDVTPAGTISKNGWLSFRLMRDDSAGTMTGTAFLVGVMVEYIINSARSKGQ